MTTQTNLIQDRCYWWAAYCRRWARMISSSANVFTGTACLLLGMVLLDPSPKGYLVAIYWLLSLQVCYDDALNCQVYLGWAAAGLLISLLAWSSMSSEALYVVIQFTVVGVSLMWAYTAWRRKRWGEWWSRFTYYQPQGCDDSRSFSTEELCLKFGLGRKREVKPHQANTFLRTMKQLDYVRPHRPIAYTQDVTWLELDPTQSDLVQYFLDRGVLPPNRTWLKDYTTKNKMPVSASV